MAHLEHANHDNTDKQQKEIMDQRKKEGEQKTKESLLAKPQELTKLADQLSNSSISKLPFSAEEQQKNAGDLKEAKGMFMKDVQSIASNSELSPEKRQKEMENAWSEFSARLDTIQGRQEIKDGWRSTEQAKNITQTHEQNEQASKSFFEQALQQLDTNHQQKIAEAKKNGSQWGDVEQKNHQASLEKSFPVDMRMAFGSEAPSKSA